MKDWSYVQRVFEARLEAARALQPPGWTPRTVLELGPGESLLGAAAARARGAERIWLVDAVDHAAWDDQAWQRLLRDWKGEPWPDIADREAFLRACQGTHLVGGLEVWSALPDGSVDFLWSQAVLEHIPLASFDALIAQMHRVLAPEGVASHWVDLQDHLGGGLANLRFDRTTWEAPGFADSGFYTNRIRFQEMVARFQRGGFRTEVGQVRRWLQLPLARARMAAEFQHLSDEDLCVSGFELLLRKQP
jgi:SAM-dependent methyltransferase